METETQIAEGNVKLCGTNTHFCSQEHHASCKRFLAWLEDNFSEEVGGLICYKRNVNDKIQDLVGVIEIYEGAGFK